MQLEYQFGKLPEYRPALEDVLTYYQMVPKLLWKFRILIIACIIIIIVQAQNSEVDQDIKMRETIYSLLSAEGSLTSQMVSVFT